MRVALLCPYDWSYPGGVRSHISGLSAALNDKGVETTIIAPSTRSEPDIQRAGATLGVAANGSTARICFSVSARARVRTLLEQGGYDLVHLHEPLIPSVPLLGLSATTLPCVGTFHASSAGSAGYRIASPVLRRGASRLASRIAVSTAAREFAARYFPGEYSIVPNGLDTGRYRSGPAWTGLEDRGPVILFVGRDEPRKGLPVLLSAMASLRERIPAHLVLVGPRSAPAETWITHLERVSDEELPSIYRAADVFCAPSTGGESFGIVLAEAMAAGTAVVCSDLAGYREAGGDAAIFCSPGDPSELSSAIERALSPAHRRKLVQAGKRRARELDWATLSRKILDIYSGALSSRQHLEKGE